MSSSIYDPFVVTNLPRLPSKTDVSKLCFTTEINNANSSNFDISISGSYVATFITRPSPKLIWSYALSPQATVTCMDSFDYEDLNKSNSITGTENDKKIFAIGINERKKHFLKYITYGMEEADNGTHADDENQSSSVSVVNEEDRHATELENIKEVKDKSITLDSEVAGIKFAKDLKHTYALFSNGEISILDFTVDQDVKDLKKLTYTDNKSVKDKIIFHAFIKPEQLKVNSRSDKIDYLLLTVEEATNKKSPITVRVFSLNTNEILELANTAITNIKDISKIKFTYDISGKLVILENAGKLFLKSFDLPMLNNEQSINITGVFKHEPVNAPTSVMCASTNRILVTKGSTVSLIDTQNESLLSSLDLYSRSKETSGAKPARNATLLNVPAVLGNTLRSKKTYALLILKNTKENYSQIQYISIDVGLGKLRDALVSIPEDEEEAAQTAQFVNFTNYLNNDDIIADMGVCAAEVSKINEQVARKNSELNLVYERLAELKASGDINLLENNVISYLKNKPFGELYEDNEYKVFEAEKDRFVDPNFFKMIVTLLFDYNSSQDTISLNSKAEETEIPEHALTYVLTHPLFPIKYAHGLLKNLEAFPRLQRQAIVTCANVSCCDLILELSNAENDEIFKDIVTRLNDEFSAAIITKETIEIMKKKNVNFDLDKIINKIIKLNYGYEILNSFIDSNGLILSLHYSKDASQLSTLLTQAQLKVESLIEDTQLLTLIDQSLTNVETNSTSTKDKKSVRKNKKKGKHNGADGNSTFGGADTSMQDIEVGMNKLDMMLRVGAPDVFSGNKPTRTKITSTYTIDRLPL